MQELTGVVLQYSPEGEPNEQFVESVVTSSRDGCVQLGLGLGLGSGFGLGLGLGLGLGEARRVPWPMGGV